MKLQELKQAVFRLACISNTQRLKKERPDLTQGRDLRYKKEWESMLELLNQRRSQGLELSLTDLDESEAMLKDSLFKVGRLAGLPDKAMELDWQRIKLESQFRDLHIEEL
jgi:hypothetical protein